HLRLALGLQPHVVLAQPLTHRGHALQGQLGDRTLLLGRRREHVDAVLLAGSQPLRLRPLRHLRRRREVGALAPPIVAVAPRPAALAAVALAAPIVTGSTIAPVPTVAVAPVATIAVAIPT